MHQEEHSRALESRTVVTVLVFRPASAGVGAHTVTYTFTDINGCNNSSDQSVNVDEEPVADAGPDADERDGSHFCRKSFIWQR